MDAQAQNSVCVSEKEQLNAPSGWTKKLIPAKAKNITLRKYDIIFIAPDGQEVKSKWHLQRYLKAHPESPAFSEFIWSSGEETPIRRSARFATREASEINKSVAKKKGKRNASEMDAEEMEEDQVKTPARKRAKNIGKLAGSVDKSAVEDEIDVPQKDEVMHEVQDETIPCDNEGTQYAAPVSEVQKDEGNDQSLVDVYASKEAVTEKAIDKELEEAENPAVSNAAEGGEQEECTVEEVHEQVEAAIIGTATDSGLQAEVEVEGMPEISPPVGPSDELMKDREPAMESEKPIELADDSVGELKEPADQSFEVIKDVSYKVIMETSVIQEVSMVQELKEDSGKPLEPLMQKEEQERLLNNQNSPLRAEHSKEKGPNEFSSSSVPVSVANQ